MTFLDQTGLERLWMHIIGRLNGMVQSVRTINGKSLTSDITLTAADVGADEAGAADTALAAAQAYTDTEIAELINSAPTTLDTLGEIATAMKESDDVVAALDAAVGTKANASDLNSHTGNTTVHITSGERTSWNGAVSHISDTTKHITAAERTNWNSAKTHADTEHVLSVNGMTGDVMIDVASKQDAITGTEGQFVIIGADGKPTTKTILIAEEATF